jgi:hypothetical protein
MPITGAQPGSVQLVASLGNKTLTANIQTNGSVLIQPSCTAPAILTGQSASMAYVSGTQAIITFASAHGLAGTETLAAFWTGGTAYEGSITSHDTLTAHVTFAAGTSVPTPGPTTVNVAIGQSLTDLTLVGANLEELLIDSTQAGYVDMLDGTATSRLHSDIGPSNGSPGPYVWPQYSAEAVPFSQTITDIVFYNNSTTAATMTVTASVA